jgi:hypothetical protein
MTSGYFPQPKRHVEIAEAVFVQSDILLMGFAYDVTITARSTQDLPTRGKLFVWPEAISQEGRTFVRQQK